jgi:hypothetical protein
MNNNKQQTAVELFIEQLEAQGESWENVSIGRIQISIKVEDYLKLIDQAKEMEKQQIMDAFGVGCHHESKRLVGYQDIAEQYYNETFNQKP